MEKGRKARGERKELKHPLKPGRVLSSPERMEKKEREREEGIHNYTPRPKTKGKKIRQEKKRKEKDRTSQKREK